MLHCRHQLRRRRRGAAVCSLENLGHHRWRRRLLRWTTCCRLTAHPVTRRESVSLAPFSESASLEKAVVATTVRTAVFAICVGRMSGSVEARRRGLPCRSSQEGERRNRRSSLSRSRSRSRRGRSLVSQEEAVKTGLGASGIAAPFLNECTSQCRVHVFWRI